MQRILFGEDDAKCKQKAIYECSSISSSGVASTNRFMTQNECNIIPGFRFVYPHHEMKSTVLI